MVGLRAPRVGCVGTAHLTHILRNRRPTISIECSTTHKVPTPVHILGAAVLRPPLSTDISTQVHLLRLWQPSYCREAVRRNSSVSTVLRFCFCLVRGGHVKPCSQVVLLACLTTTSPALRGAWKRSFTLVFVARPRTLSCVPAFLFRGALQALLNPGQQPH